MHLPILVFHSQLLDEVQRVDQVCGIRICDLTSFGRGPQTIARGNTHFTSSQCANPGDFHERHDAMQLYVQRVLVLAGPLEHELAKEA